MDMAFTDRRCEEDRRSADAGAPPGTPDRRGPGRPRTGRRKTVTRHVKQPEVDDLEMVAAAQFFGLSVNAFIAKSVRAAVAFYKKTAVRGGS